MTHHGHYRCPGLRRTFLIGQRFLESLLDLLSTLQHHAMTKLLNDQGRCVLIQHLIDIRHYPEVH